MARGSESERPGVCEGCPNGDPCREVWGMERRGDFTPAGLSLGSVAVFIFPLIGAVVGAIILQGSEPVEGSSSWRQIAGAGIGLVGGVVLALLVMPAIRKYGTDKEKCRADSAGSGD